MIRDAELHNGLVATVRRAVEALVLQMREAESRSELPVLRSVLPLEINERAAPTKAFVDAKNVRL